MDVERGQVGSPGAEEVPRITDLVIGLFVGLTELDEHIIKVLQGHLLRFKDLPASPPPSSS